MSQRQSSVSSLLYGRQCTLLVTVATLRAALDSDLTGYDFLPVKDSNALKPGSREEKSEPQLKKLVDFTLGMKGDKPRSAFRVFFF